MLHATQPWLPLLDEEPRTDVVVHKAKRRAASALPAAAPGPDSRAARQAFLGIVSSWNLLAIEALRLLGEPLIPASA